MIKIIINYSLLLNEGNCSLSILGLFGIASTVNAGAAFCPAGTYYSSSSCIACPSGLTSVAGSSTCSAPLQNSVKICSYTSPSNCLGDSVNGAYGWILANSPQSSATVFDIVPTSHSTIGNTYIVTAATTNRFVQPYFTSVLESATGYTASPYVLWTFITTTSGGNVPTGSPYTIGTSTQYLDYQGNMVDSTRANLDSNSQVGWNIICVDGVSIFNQNFQCVSGGDGL